MRHKTSRGLACIGIRLLPVMNVEFERLSFGSALQRRSSPERIPATGGDSHATPTR